MSHCMSGNFAEETGGEPVFCGVGKHVSQRLSRRQSREGNSCTVYRLVRNCLGVRIRLRWRRIGATVGFPNKEVADSMLQK